MMSECDIAIIGGGPIGIWGLYHAHLRQVNALLFDSLPELGGQLMAMYPEKDIFDVAGFPRVLARELVEQLMAQSVDEPTRVRVGEKVLALTQFDGLWQITTTLGQHLAKSVVVATGLGAFRPKALGVPGEERFEGQGVDYFVKSLDALAGKRLIIVGGGDSAVDWVNTFSGRSEVTMVHRLERFQAHPASVQRLVESGVEVLMPWEVSALSGDDHLQTVTVRALDGSAERQLPCDQLLVCIGFNADLGPLKAWGLALSGGKVAVDREMRTNQPGVFAAGDVVTYPGKQNLIAVGFAEIAVAIKAATEHAFPGVKSGLAHSSSRGF
ncbi:MAG: NAD(P)/FAD-dependent oxidoreductase [Sulfobacillus sp.]